MKHTSSARYNVILAGVQLVLKESGEKLNGLRRQSKGRSYSVAEREIRMNLRLIKEAVNLAEEELDNHLSVYDKAQFFGKKHPVALPDGKCPECQNPKCDGCCDKKRDEEE